MMNTKIFVTAALLLGIAGFSSAQTSPTGTTAHGSNAPYTEGPVWVLTMIKTKTGLGDDYLKSISGNVKRVYEEEEKQKTIFDYKIMNGDAYCCQKFNSLTF